MLVTAEQSWRTAIRRHGFDYSLTLTLPPLAVIWLEVPQR